jgi:holo-[acyl-carrier protein] synthase
MSRDKDKASVARTLLLDGGKDMPEVLGIGLDLVEVARIERAVARWGDCFLSRVFTPREIADCLVGRGGFRSEALAARFAAKEAVFKALGRGRPELGWHDAEVVSDAWGKPQVVLSGRALSLAAELGVVRVLVSLTHLRGLAGAQVVASGRSAVRPAE